MVSIRIQAARPERELAASTATSVFIRNGERIAYLVLVPESLLARSCAGILSHVASSRRSLPCTLQPPRSPPPRIAHNKNFFHFLVPEPHPRANYA